MADDDYLTRKAAAAYLNRIGSPVSPQTLAAFAMRRHAGRGPAFTRTLGRIVRYRRADLDAWALKVTERLG